MYFLAQHFRSDQRNAIFGHMKPFPILDGVKPGYQARGNNTIFIGHYPLQAGVPPDIHIRQYHRVFDIAVAAHLHI